MNDAVLRSLPVSLTLTLLLAGCGGGSSSSGTTGGGGSDAGPPIDPLTLDPTKPGPFTCGHRQLSTTYTPPGGIAARTIPVHVWYPSTSTDGDHPRYVGVFQDNYAYDDVPLATPGWKTGLPVLVHSHGYKGFAGNSARLMCFLASHGWLAVAPEHVGNTISDTPDTLPLEIYIERPFDIRAALDFVTALPKGDPLHGKADMTHVAMSGHSFGTYTAWAVGGATLDGTWFSMQCTSGGIAACSDAELAVLAGDVTEKRAQIIIPMAGAPNGQVTMTGYDAATVPVLMMSGSLNPVGDDVVFAAVTKLDLTWVDVENGCHQLFGLGNTVLGAAGCAALPDEAGFALVNPWVLMYARYHVLGDRSAEVKGVVEGTTSFSPAITFQHEGP